MATVSTVAVAGISGKLALEIAADLLQRPGLQLRGSSRDISKLPAFLKNAPNVTLVQSGPYDRDALRTLISGSDIVVCCYYADDEVMLEGQKLLIDLCEDENIPRYIASDYTADFTRVDFGDIQLKDPMKHVKANLDARTKVKGVHILVGLMMETFWEYFDVWRPEEKKLRYWGSGTESWDLTAYHTAAQYVAAVILDPTAVGVMRCRLSTPGSYSAVLADTPQVVGQKRSIQDIAKDVEAVLSHKPQLENSGSLEDVQRNINPEGGAQNPVAYVLLRT
jgi:hypothetical protein